MSDNDAGLSIIYKGGYVSDLAICIDPTDRFYGWLLARNPLDGQWVSLAKMDANATNLHEAREKIATLEAALAAEREQRKAAEALLHAKGEMLFAVVQGAKEEFVRVPYGASHEDVAAINEWHKMAAEALAAWENEE